MVGAFHHPKKVYADVSLLKTLPKRELGNGCAEIIKMALVFDKPFFKYVEKNVDKAMKRDPKVLEQMIAKSCEYKAKVVERDEKESGARTLLNFGHTIGHAIEKATGYEIRHGEAVAIGMIAELEISRKEGMNDPCIAERLKSVLKSASLPTKIPRTAAPEVTKWIRFDKKNKAGKPRFVLLKEAGAPRARSGEFAIEASPETIRSAIKECL